MYNQVIRKTCYAVANFYFTGFIKLKEFGLEISTNSAFSNFTSPSQYYLRKTTVEHENIVKKSPYRYLSAATFAGGTLGSLHGVYKKIELDTLVEKLFGGKSRPKDVLKLALLNPDIFKKIKLKVAVMLKDGHDGRFSRWKLENGDDIVRSFVSRIFALTDIEPQKTEPTGIDYKNLKVSLFKKVLNPIDEFVSSFFRKCGLGKFVDFMDKSNNVIRSVPFKQNSKYCYNSGLMLKGFLAGGILLTALTALGIGVFKSKNNQT